MAYTNGCARASVLHNILWCGHIEKDSRNSSELALEYLKVTGDLFAVASDTCVFVYGILDQLVSPSLCAFEHVFLPTHRWPSDKCCPKGLLYEIRPDSLVLLLL
jgi:hypothetical protein